MPRTRVITRSKPPSPLVIQTLAGSAVGQRQTSVVSTVDKAAGVETKHKNTDKHVGWRDQDQGSAYTGKAEGYERGVYIHRESATSFRFETHQSRQNHNVKKNGERYVNGTLDEKPGKIDVTTTKKSRRKGRGGGGKPGKDLVSDNTDITSDQHIEDGPVLTEDPTFVNHSSHHNDRVHRQSALSKGRGGPIESASTETYGLSKTTKRPVQYEVHDTDDKLQSDIQRIRSRRDIRDFGIGMYFVRVLRETQNSNRDSGGHSVKKHTQTSHVNGDYINDVSTNSVLHASKEVTEDDILVSSPERIAWNEAAAQSLLDCYPIDTELQSPTSDGTELSSHTASLEELEPAEDMSCNIFCEQLDQKMTSRITVFSAECSDPSMEQTVSEQSSVAPKSSSKRKKRRRSKKASSSSLSSSSGADAAGNSLSPGLTASSSTTSFLQTDTDSGVDVGSQSSIHSSISCPTLDQITESRSSSAERLRICSSPNFTYDPDIASQIPFYFKEPTLEEYHLEPSPVFPQPPDEDDSYRKDGEDGANDDASSNCSWTEFSEEFLETLHDDEILLACDRHGGDDVAATVNSLSVDVAPSSDVLYTGATSDEVLSDCATTVSSEGASDDFEIDYDSYLPAHVLMHVKRDLVSVLMEYGQTREVKVSFKDMERSGPHHASRFHTAAIVDGETFPVGSGSSKKNAKKAAAAQALKIMYDRGRKNLEVVNEVAHKKLRAMSEEEVGSHAHRVVLVSRHVLDTAEETQFINYSKDKIAATFVLEYHGKMRVVGLGTGNRCILFQHMTLDGKRVIHSHAEIIARRAFLRYLFKQLLTYNGNRSHPIFTRSDTGKLKLRDKIQVHLYISRPPCGDAAAFPTISNFPNKMRAIRKQGQLRTIIDDGEGAIPTDFPVPAGANGKERLRIMTCSDKICRWNVLGVQGALLSHFLDPIYINSLVIGSHTGDQRGHVPRAVSGRLKCGRLHEVIQRPYRINTPDIHYPHDDLADHYNITKSKQYCITWSYGDIDAEVIDAITGVTNMETMEEVIPSRVAKVTLYTLFQQVCKRYGRHDLAEFDYLKAKRSAATFQRMKSFVGQHLAAMGFGQWYSLQDTYGTDNINCPGPC